jgi:hypothetical protein
MPKLYNKIGGKNRGTTGDIMQRMIGRIPYKADEDTYEGRYANRGNKRISKYYE